MNQFNDPSELDWEDYRRLAPAAVPRRTEQLAALIALLPGGARRIVELGCGEGQLSAAILACLPHASIVALDRSEEMKRLATERLHDFGSRATVEHFDLESDDWLPLLDGADAVVSSLAIHHLDGPGKQHLFGKVRRRLPSSGAFLIADLVAPQRREGQELFADTWDLSAEEQSMRETGGPQLFELFVDTQWNIYRWPDPMDRPSPLYEQLAMLERAGFAVVDCFWMAAGHAVYGGYVSSVCTELPPVSFRDALGCVQTALNSG